MMSDGELQDVMPEDNTMFPDIESDNGPIFHPVVALTTVQRRGSLTVPAALRQALDFQDNARCLLASQADGTVRLRVMPPPVVWFAQHDARVSETPPIAPSDAVPKRWLDTATLLRAQAYPDSSQRRWFVEGDRGFVTARVDPVVIAEWLAAVPQLITVNRSDLAVYLQVVLSWNGVVLAERDVYWAALELWGHTDDLTWPEAVRWCREEES